MPQHYSYRRRLQRQSGVVLIIAMFMLIIISLASVNAMRSSTTSEVIANSARAQVLAMQAAEAGLRYCETSVLAQMNAIAAGNTTATGTVTIASAPSVAGTSFTWESVASSWDSITATMTLVPISTINQATTVTLYQRQPECLAQYFDTGNRTKAVITARGFGPDVAAQVANASRRPVGSEVWLQSNIQVAATTTTPPVTGSGP